MPQRQGEARKRVGDKTLETRIFMLLNKGHYHGLKRITAAVVEVAQESLVIGLAA